MIAAKNIDLRGVGPVDGTVNPLLNEPLVFIRSIEQQDRLVIVN